jgi:HYR domain
VRRLLLICGLFLTTLPVASANWLDEDTTPPVLSLPGDISVSTGNPGGTSVSYSASATDNVDGPVPINCSPGSGSNFPIGTTPVNCSASDNSGNTANGSFNVTVTLVDVTPPTFIGVPGPIVREADGPNGSRANYTPPAATDDVDGGPLLVTCLPASGTRFPLGTTVVTCTVSDSHGNVGTATFTVTVRDTTPPTLTTPPNHSVYATTDSGIPASDPAAAAFLAGATATDIVDGALTVTSNAPGFFAIGTTTVTFAVTDGSGNSTDRAATLTVLPKPPEGTTPAPLPALPDRTPPDDVKDLKARAAPGSVSLSWTRPTAPDFDRVTVTRTRVDGEGAVTVYSGRGTSYTDNSVQNGVEYRYSVVSFDTHGNRSAGAVVSALPKAPLLLAPRDGARVKKPLRLLLLWAAMKDANYYNAQLFLGNKKVLSVWPKRNRFLLKKKWRFAKKSYRLRPGVYRWYVWPAYGARKDRNYGPLMGSSTFEVVS